MDNIAFTEKYKWVPSPSKIKEKKKKPLVIKGGIERRSNSIIEYRKSDMLNFNKRKGSKSPELDLIEENPDPWKWAEAALE